MIVALLFACLVIAVVIAATGWRSAVIQCNHMDGAYQRSANYYRDQITYLNDTLKTKNGNLADIRKKLAEIDEL